MQVHIRNYLENINKRFQTGISREHSYRGDLQTLLENLVTDVLVTNEPARIACGAPDYILTKRSIPVGYIEAKDIGVDLKSKNLKEQFERYRTALDNLIITDYLDFHLYRDGEFVTSIKIAEIKDNKIVPLEDNLNQFANLIQDFCLYVGQTIKSPKKLAEMMAGKARMLSEVIEKALLSDEENQENTSLREQLNGFKQILIHDITPKEFADIYSQTIAYGMFAARLHDRSLSAFSRQEASEKIPKTNPFLRKLFGYIAGPDIDERIKWIVDSLADIFTAADVWGILRNYGKSTQTQDPVVHFYETFLAEYDPKLRKARGVWYTPAPVVNFIVRAVDDILKSEFNLKEGLADTSKIKVKTATQIRDARSATGYKKEETEVHKVQILDPATGTGTFLAEIIKLIHTKFSGQEGIWSNYVENNLIPRLNGFELLMASYAMAHLKLDLLLTETGYIPTKDQRLKIYLTNSLEESHPDTGTLFASWLSAEANEANHVKRDTPVMVMIGNPPYAVSSSNKGEWIQSLIKDYKENLNERKINLDDDYIKFIRYGQYFIDKTGEGILSYITNNSFIDGITHRQLRKHLLYSFDEIYILDLHGNAKKQEKDTDGGKDENVFDITQGVSINIFIKTGKKRKNELGKVFFKELRGSRKYKYESLINGAFSTFDWKKIEHNEPYNFFVPKDFSLNKKYEEGFKIIDLFKLNNTGIQTKRDSLVYNFSKDSLQAIIKNIIELPNHTLKNIYNLPDDGRDWTIDFARKDLLKDDGVISEVLYHPFDNRFTYFTGRSKGFMAYPRSPISNNLVNENVALLAVRNSRRDQASNYFISNKLVDKDGVSPLDNCKFFPLYIYTHNQETLNGMTKRTPNLNEAVITEISEKLDLKFTSEKEIIEGTFAPIDILDYIYAILYSQKYRNKYKEFLKIDFPRVPYPKDKALFWKLIKYGSELRQIHLLESSAVNKLITKYPINGSNIVERIKYEDNKVYINETQYFEDVPQIAWNSYIGGYQPAQKWLKDRKDIALNFEDILYYQKIIVALTQTDRIMKEIDKLLVDVV